MSSKDLSVNQVDDVNGIAKTWIDRLAYVCYRPAFAGKCAYLVATVGSSPTGHTLRTMNAALRTWGFQIIGQAGFKMGALMPQDEVESLCRQQAARIGEALFQAIAQQCFLRPSFLSLLIFKIQQRVWQQEMPGSVDYAYWQDQGWLDPGRDFYIEHQAGRLKVALARLAGAVAARLVT